MRNHVTLIPFNLPSLKYSAIFLTFEKTVLAMKKKCAPFTFIPAGLVLIFQYDNLLFNDCFP